MPSGPALNVGSRPCPTHTTLSPEGPERAQGVGGEREEELPVIGAGPLPTDRRERVPTPRVSTTRIGMQEHKLD